MSAVIDFIKVSPVALLMEQSRTALQEMHNKSQSEVDLAVRLIAKAINDNAVLLAELAVEETRLGNVPDKILKCQAKSQLIYADLKDRKTVGVISQDAQSGITEIAEPVGVVAALIPTTNPAVTAMCNAMIAIKARNTIILSPHRRAFKTIQKTLELMIQATNKAGLPSGTIQMIEEPNRDSTRELMSSADMVLATGGAAMVQAAYESGSPSYGVGPGNVPVVIHESADINDAAQRIVIGKAYDNGLICASEQAVIAPRSKIAEVKQAFAENGAWLITEPESRKKLQNLMWIDGHLNPDIVGQSAIDLAAMAEIELPNDEIKVLMVEESLINPSAVFSREKLSPVLALYQYDNFDKALDVATRILENGGLGHTAGIHVKNDTIATQFAMHMPASRIIVNQSTATTAGGSRENGLVPTTTMGCGTWGNNATSDNVSVNHLMNIKRLAFKHAHLRDTSTLLSG